MQYPKLVIKIRHKWKGQIRYFIYLYYYLPRKWAIKIWVSRSNDKEQNDSVNELKAHVRRSGCISSDLDAFKTHRSSATACHNTIHLPLSLLFWLICHYHLKITPCVYLFSAGHYINLYCGVIYIYIYFNHILLSCQ